MEGFRGSSSSSNSSNSSNGGSEPDVSSSSGWQEEEEGLGGGAVPSSTTDAKATHSAAVQGKAVVYHVSPIYQALHSRGDLYAHNNLKYNNITKRNHLSNNNKKTKSSIYLYDFMHKYASPFTLFIRRYRKSTIYIYQGTI